MANASIFVLFSVNLAIGKNCIQLFYLKLLKTWEYAFIILFYYWFSRFFVGKRQ